MSFLEELAPFAAQKLLLRDTEVSFEPLPLLASGRLHQWHRDRHERTRGFLPSLSLYSFKDSTVGPWGFVLSPEKKICYAPDLIGDFAKDMAVRRLEQGDASDTLVRAVRGASKVLEISGDHPVLVLNKPGYQVYGHWLVDILPCIWLFMRERLKHGVDPRSTLYLLPEGVPSWAMNMLGRLFGIGKDNIIFYNEVDTVVKAKTFLLASKLNINDYFSPQAALLFQEIVATIASKPDNQFPKRFYVTRRAVKSFVPRSVTNADALEAVAVASGLKVIDPATMSWPDQIRLFADAELVVGPFGSGLHNALFSPASTVLLSLGAANMNWIKSGISAVRRQRMAYLLPSSEKKEGAAIALEYDPQHLAQVLDELCLP